MLKKLSIISVVLLSVLTSCTNDMKEVMALPSNKRAPSQIGDSVTMIYTDSAQLKVIVKANRMLMYTKQVQEPFTVLTNGVFVTFFDEEEKISTTLKARYAVRFEGSNRMEVRYGVVVVNKEGKKLETEKLIWDQATKRIYTDAPVKISTDKEVITGKGLDSNEDFSRYEMQEVTGIIKLKGDEL